MKTVTQKLNMVLLLSFAFSAFAGGIDDPTKPTPEKDIETILRTLDCAGTVEGVSVRLKPGAVKQTEGEYEILVDTTHATFPKSFTALGTYTSREQYVVHGDTPEAFMLLIDKLGVHGAHNAALEFPLSPGERYTFECYFY
ncbi:MAG: hypothetical protein AABZ31_09930 [Bdellovibrionota bacterium]